LDYVTTLFLTDELHNMQLHVKYYEPWAVKCVDHYDIDLESLSKTVGSISEDIDLPEIAVK
jgi:hypothetical protein